MHTETNVTLPDLGVGASYALWGFRTAAIKNEHCPHLIRGFEEALAVYGRPALKGLTAMARELGSSGGRRLNIACPECRYATADEMSIVGLLSAAQERHMPLIDAHLSWLMCGVEDKAARQAAFDLGALFAAAGLKLEKPPIEITPAPQRGPVTSFYRAGHA